MSDYRLSDFTPAGWILILTFLPVALGLGFVFAKLWFAMGFRKITNGIFALPGIAYMGLYWAVCRKLGIRLVKDRR